MNKKIVVLLVLLFSFGLFGENHWRQVGQSGIGGTIAFDSADSIYLGFMEKADKEDMNAPYYVSVKKYDITTKRWEYVGKSRFSSPILSDTEIERTFSFVVSEDKLFVLFITNGSQPERKIMTYNENSAQWEYLSENIPKGSTPTVLLSDKIGNLYLAFHSIDGLEVAMRDKNTTEWHIIAKPIVTYSDAHFHFFIDSQGTPFISYIQEVIQAPDQEGVAVVSSYNKTDNLWDNLGNSGFSGVLTSDFPQVPTIVTSNLAHSFVSFLSEDRATIKVMQYDTESKKWLLLPNSTFEGALVLYLSLNNNSELFASLRYNTSAKIMKYNVSTSSWDVIGKERNSCVGAPVFSSTNAIFVSCDGMIITFDDQPDDPDTGDTADSANTSTDIDNTTDSRDSANTSADTDNTADSGDSADDTSDNENSSDSDGGNACAAVVIW